MAAEITLTPEAEQDIAQAEKLLAVAREYKIDSPQIMEAAAGDLKNIKLKAKDLEERRMAMTRPLDESKKRIMDFFRAPLQYLTDAERLIKRSMLAYQDEQDRKRREQEAKLREAQRKEQERLQKRAEVAAAKGQEEKAEVLREAAEMMPTPVVANHDPSPQGISTRETWSAEVFDKMALILAVAEGQVPDAVLAVDMKVLNAQARALKSAMKYPGVKAVASKTIAAGR
jgi:hypothetical protein